MGGRRRAIGRGELLIANCRLRPFPEFMDAAVVAGDLDDQLHALDADRLAGAVLATKPPLPEEPELHPATRHAAAPSPNVTTFANFIRLLRGPRDDRGTLSQAE